MKRTKEHEETQTSMMKNVFCLIGNHLVKKAGNPRGCIGSMLYETELTDEMISDMVSDK